MPYLDETGLAHALEKIDEMYKPDIITPTSLAYSNPDYGSDVTNVQTALDKLASLLSDSDQIIYVTDPKTISNINSVYEIFDGSAIDPSKLVYFYTVALKTADGSVTRYLSHDFVSMHIEGDESGTTLIFASIGYSVPYNIRYNNATGDFLSIDEWFINAANVSYYNPHITSVFQNVKEALDALTPLLSNTGPSMQVLTETEYNALTTKDPNTLYFIKE